MTVADLLSALQSTCDVRLGGLDRLVRNKKAAAAGLDRARGEGSDFLIAKTPLLTDIMSARR
jgi:hypothetical protein